MTKMKLYWIDDVFDKQDLPSEAERELIEDALGAELVAEKVGSRSRFAELVESMNPEETLGIVMDYQLQRVDSGSDTKGSVWAAEVRIKHPEIPVIGISHLNENQIPRLQLANFLAFFPRSRLAEPQPEYENLNALCLGYHEVFKYYSDSKTRKRISGSELMSTLARVPTDLEQLFQSAIPQGLRGDWDDETPHVAGRWFWHDLQGRPGFLLDRLQFATHLGLNIEGLQIVLSAFENAQYNGVFASPLRPRWWISEVRALFEDAIGEGVVGPVSHLREQLLTAFDVPSEKQGRFFAEPWGRPSGSVVPNCVAFPDHETRDDDARVQTIFEDTVVLERDQRQPFGFEPLRTFKATS